MKKFIILIIAIILIFAIILGMKIINNKHENKYKYSRLDVINLIKTGKDYDNYYCEYNNLGEKTIRKLNKNKLVVIGNDMTIYADFDTNKQTIIQNTGNLAIVSNLDSSSLEKINKIYFQECIDILNDYDKYKYEFIKKEKIKEFECIRINLTSETLEYGIWIDISSGLVTKISLKNKQN